MLVPGASFTGNRVNMTVGAATVPAKYSQGIGLMANDSIAGDSDAPAGNIYSDGYRQSALGALYVTTTVAATDIFISGLRVSLLGQIVYQSSAPDTYVNGNPIMANGALAVSP